MAVCGGAGHDAVVMADIIFCEIAGTADKQQAELLPDGQPWRRQWRTGKQVTHRRRRKRRVEAGYSHSVGSAVGDVVGGYDGDHDRDDSEALIQRDSNAGIAVDGVIRQCGRVWVGRPNGHGGVGVIEGRCISVMLVTSLGTLAS